jgi:DNA-binding transcriptional regulator GbsR (MarR family)
MDLPPLIQSFVLHFGEMGSRWGINRTVGQIYALLYLSPSPLNADEIGEKLGFSRSNVSMGLKELESWNLVQLQHMPGDRRQYFRTPGDVWEIFRILAEERKKREIDPTLTLLRSIILEKPGSKHEAHAQAKMAEMHSLMELVVDWHNDMRKLDTESLKKLLLLGSRVQRVLDLKDKIPLINRKAKPKKER